MINKEKLKMPNFIKNYLKIKNLVMQLKKKSKLEVSQVAKQKALFAVITKIRESLDLDSIFKSTASEVRQLLNADRVGMYRFDENSNYICGEFVSEDVLSPYTSALAARISDKCFAETQSVYYAKGKIWACEDIYKAKLQDCHIAILSRFDVRANLVVPLLKKDRLWGLLCIHQCRSPRKWQASEKEFVSQIATHLGIALQQAEQMNQLQLQSQNLTVAVKKAVKREKAVATIIDKIRRSLDINTIFQTTTLEVRQLLKADRVAIYRFNEDWSGKFEVESVGQGWVSLCKKQLENLEICRNISDCSIKLLDKYSDSYLKETRGGNFSRDKVFRVCDDIYNKGFSECYISKLESYQAKAYVIIAIYEGNKLWGLLAVFQNSGPRNWEDSEVNFLIQIGAHLGVAIQQATLLATTKQRKEELQTALTAELQKRAEELAKEAERERALALVIDKIRRTLDINTIFQTATTEVKKLLGVERIAIYKFREDYSGDFIFESEPQEFPPLVGCDWEDNYLKENKGGRFRHNISCIANNIYENNLSDCHIHQLERFAVKSYAVVPLFQREKLWGLMSAFQHSGPRQWQPDEIKLLEQVAIQLGVALQQTDNIQQIQQQAIQQVKAAQQERALTEVIDKIRQSLDLEEIFQIASQEVRQLLNADRVAIFQFHPDSNWTEGEFVSEDVSSEFPSAVAARVKDSCFGSDYAIDYHQRHILAVEDIYNQGLSDCHIEILARFDIKANLVIPLLKNNFLWGLLCIHQCSQTRKWQQSEIEFTTKIALQLGVALQQAELLAQAEKRSTELTTALAQVESQKEQQTKAANQERALALVIDKIRRTLDLETIFKTTATEVRQLLNADRVAIFQFYPDSNWTEGEFVSEDVLPKFKSVLASRVKDKCFGEKNAQYYQNRRIWAIEDIDEAGLLDCHVSILSRFDVKANLVAPLLKGKTLWGLLCIHQCSQTRKWQDSEKEFTAKIAVNLGVALQQADLLRQTQLRSLELKETLADLNAIVDNLADGLLVTDIYHNITRLNPALLYMFSLNNDLIGENIKNHFPLDLFELVKKTKSNEKETVTVDVELENGRSGQALATSIVKEGEGDEGDVCVGSVILIRDVTLEREVDRMKTDFLATVSHELRTPLTSVLGFACIIKDKLEECIFPALEDIYDNNLQKTNTRIQENIDIIISEAERLTVLINDVLDIAKMESGKVEWNIQSVYIEHILERAIAATASLFEKHSLKLVKDIPLGLPQVEVDCDRIIQVVINLISNAVKFTSEGIVTCRARVDHNNIIISIIDTGIGVAQEQQEQIFERFKQVGNILTNKPKGTGLGLPICKQIIEYHGGKIWMESTLSQGSNFSFTIPL